MIRLRRISALAAVGVTLFATACEWPTSGTGGLAELGKPANPALEQANATIERMKQSGGEKYAAADLIDARLLLTRAERENAGGLQAAAESDLVRLNVIFERIERRLATTSRQAGGSRIADGAPYVLP